MRITIDYYSKRLTWGNEYGKHGHKTSIGRLDETNLQDAIDVFAALLVAAGWSVNTIKDCMYEYGRSEFPEEV
jgi:hypothetical protein